MNALENYKKESEKFEKRHRDSLKAQIQEELAKLIKDEVVELTVYTTGEHNDVIGSINKKGIMVVHTDGDPNSIIHDDVNVRDTGCDARELAEILDTCVQHNKTASVDMIRQRIPAGYLDLVQRGLNLLELALKEADKDEQDQIIGHNLFDIMTVRGLLKGEIYTEFTKEQKKKFIQLCGVDFPDLLGDENQPVEFKKRG